MIGFWNCREVYIGRDMKAFSQVRDALAAEGIDYTYRVKNSASRGIPTSEGMRGTVRSYTGSAGTDLSKAYEYRVFVHKKDYEKARRLLAETGR